MGKITQVIIAVILLPLSLAADVVEEESIFSVGRISESWNRMNTVQKCFAAIVIPPGYVAGICCKSVTWLFWGRDKL